MEIKTKKEQERDERNKQIANRFKALMQGGGNSANKVIGVLTGEYGLVYLTIRNILIEQGVYDKYVRKSV